MIKVIGNRPVMKKGDNEIGVVGDNKVKTLDFSIDRIQGGIDLSGYSAWGLIERSPINGGESYSTLVTKTTLSDKITISLPITSNETRNYGYIYASIKFGSSKNITSFSDYGSGRIKATSTAHGIVGTQTGVVISGTTDYNGTYTVTRIDANNFYFTGTWVSNQTGWWGVSPIWQTERVLLKIAKGINGETEAEALAPDIFASQIAAFQEALDEALTLDYVLLDQSTPQSFTGGEVSGSGLLKVTSGAIGLDETPYVDSNTTFWNVLDDKASALSFGTSAEPRMLELVTTSGRKRVYVSKDLQIGGNIELRATTADSGQIKIGEHRFIHNYGSQCLFIGYDSGNFTMTGSSNSAVGYNALTSNTTGSDNTAMGSDSLRYNTTGTYNAAMGYGSLRYNTTGNHNSAMGSDSLRLNTTGTYNTAMGSNSLHYNTTGRLNSAMGSFSLQSNTTGIYNAAMGYGSLTSNTTGGSNSAMGNSSLYSNTTGEHNSAMGCYSLTSNTTGSDNTAMGSDSLRYNTTGTYNAAMGYGSLRYNTTGNHNSAMGSDSLRLNTTGTYNTAMGSNSLHYNTTGRLNSAMGSFSLQSNTTGEYNSAMGYYSLRSNTTGTYNTAMGSDSLRSNTTGGQNAAMGYYSLYSLKSGASNIAIGSQSGQTCTNINNSIFIGSSTKALNNSGDTNEIVIGHNATGNGSNTVTLGHTDIVSTVLRGDVKIGTKLTDSTGTDAAKTITMVKTDSSDKIATTQFVKNVLADFEVPEGGFVPYNGATEDVDLGEYTFTAKNITTTGTVTGSNLSGTNTGDQDLTDYATKEYVDENAGSTALTELTGSVLSVGNFYKTVSEGISFTLPYADTSKSNLIMLDLKVVGNISIGFGTTYAANMSVPLMVAGNYLVSWEYSNIVGDWIVTALPYGVIV